MADCNELLSLIRASAEGEEKAMRLMLKDKHYQIAAFKAFKNYEKIHSIVGWEDIFYDAIVRFVHMVRRFELNGKELKYDCMVYFKTICRNICAEYARNQRPVDPRFYDLFEIPADLVPEFNASMAEKLMGYFSQLKEKCQTLLEARFLWNPQEKDKEALSALVNGKVKPSAISTTLGRCKENLRDIVGDNLQDILHV